MSGVDEHQAVTSPSPVKFRMSISMLSSSLPPNPCCFHLHFGTVDTEPVAAMVYLPPPDLSILRESAEPVVVGKKASKSKKRKSVMLGGKPWMGVKLLSSLYDRHVDMVCEYMGKSSPVALYAGDDFGVTFDSPPPPSGVEWTVSVTCYDLIPFASVLPTKESLDRIKKETLADESLEKKNIFKVISTSFVDLLPPPVLSPVESPIPVDFSFKILRSTILKPPMPPPPRPFGLCCMTCERSLNHLKAALDHYSKRHSTTILPPAPDEIWRMHSPLIFQPTFCPPAPPAPALPPLKVAYIDATVAIIVKPQGIPVQGGENPLCRMDLLLAVSYKNNAQSGSKSCWKDENDYVTGVVGDITRTPLHPPTTAPPLLAYNASRDALTKVKPCHRIDSATGGLLICARTKKASSLIPQLFATGDKNLLQKRYRAIVFGNVRPDEGEVNEPVDGKESLSKFVVVSRDPFQDPQYPSISTITTVDLYPITGRQHQLRKHMQHLGHPILGDRKYANYSKNVDYGEGHELMCLWAVEVDFKHPFTNDKVKVSIREPDLYQTLRNRFATPPPSSSPPNPKRPKSNIYV